MKDNTAGLLVTLLSAGVILVTLKACRMINLSWLIVTIPFWGPVAVVILLLLVAVVTKALARAFRWIAERL